MRLGIGSTQTHVRQNVPFDTRGRIGNSALFVQAVTGLYAETFVAHPFAAIALHLEEGRAVVEGIADGHGDVAVGTQAVVPTSSLANVRKIANATMDPTKKSE